jgi:hypothetical protein
MKFRLQQAGLLRNKDDDLEINISLAWSLLSRLGCPARYGGRAQDGSHEYIIVNPHTGDFLATGKGVTLARSMCESALNASSLISPDSGDKSH